MSQLESIIFGNKKFSDILEKFIKTKRKEKDK